MQVSFEEREVYPSSLLLMPANVLFLKLFAEKRTDWRESWLSGTSALLQLRLR
jgi:hypothetical protein